MARRMSKSERRGMRRKLWELQGRKCCYCRRYVYLDFDHGAQTASIEHLRRLTDGGTDHPDNLAVACQACNSRRGDRSWVEFATIMAPKLRALPITTGGTEIEHHGRIG